jgi:hypothetical protein
MAHEHVLWLQLPVQHFSAAHFSGSQPFAHMDPPAPVVVVVIMPPAPVALVVAAVVVVALVPLCVLDGAVVVPELSDETVSTPPLPLVGPPGCSCPVPPRPRMQLPRPRTPSAASTAAFGLPTRLELIPTILSRALRAPSIAPGAALHGGQLPQASTLFGHCLGAPLPQVRNLQPAAALLVHFSQHVAPASQMTF